MNFQKIRFFAVFFIFIPLLLSACVTPPPPPEEPPVIVEEPPVEPEEPEPVVEPEEFVVTEEIYQQTFEDVETLIARINDTVIAQDYDTWLTYLTEDYINYYSDRDLLAELSDDLAKSTGYKVRLRSLKDYFRYVVVNSRIDVKLDRIEFIDEYKVTAEAIINDTPYVLYFMEKIDGTWKVAKW